MMDNFDKLWDYDNPSESERRFRELEPQLHNSKAKYIELLTQIARAQGLQRKFAEAHSTLDEVEKLLEPTFYVAKIRSLLERGRVFHSSGEKAKARPFFLEAFGLAKEFQEDFYAVDAAHMLAIIEPPEQQMHWHEVAIEICEGSNDERTKNWLGSLYNNLGWTYHGQGNYQAALETFQKALEFRLQQDKPREIIIAKWSIARTLRSLGRYQEAVDIQLRLEKELETRAEPDGYVYEELAECLLLLGQIDKAKHYFGLAYRELAKDTWLKENEKERLECLKQLS
jgi:tetratricopeptide (TPR) repeat protein